MTAIHVHSLHKSYGSVHALRGIDLSIPATGQIVGLLGPNGAGKTTLVEILEGLRAASSGEVSVLGLNPATAPNQLRVRIGVQLQSTAFINELSVIETLRLYAAFYPRSLAPVDVLRKVDLEDRARRWSERCPVDSASASRSRWRCCTTRISTSSTSPRRVSIRWRAGRSTRS
jgi:ABC-2 type transport system ATP-binding protein